MKTLFAVVSLLFASLASASQCGTHTAQVTLFTVNSAGVLNLGAVLVTLGNPACSFFGDTMTVYNGPAYLSGINALFTSTDGQTVSLVQDGPATNWTTSFAFPIGNSSASVSGYLEALNDVQIDYFDPITHRTTLTTHTLNRQGFAFTAIATQLATPVPEPAEYAMMLGGLFMLVVCKRKKPTSATR